MVITEKTIQWPLMKKMFKGIKAQNLTWGEVENKKLHYLGATVTYLEGK